MAMTKNKRAEFRLAPIYATEEMMLAGEAAFGRIAQPGVSWAEHTGAIWRAMMDAAPAPTPVKKNPDTDVFVLPDHGVEVGESEWPEILERTSKMEAISTGQGTHCCDETFSLDGCNVSLIYDYVDQSEPVCILRYKPTKASHD